MDLKRRKIDEGGNLLMAQLGAVLYGYNMVWGREHLKQMDIWHNAVLHVSSHSHKNVDLCLNRSCCCLKKIKKIWCFAWTNSRLCVLSEELLFITCYLLWYSAIRLWMFCLNSFQIMCILRRTTVHNVLSAVVQCIRWWMSLLECPHW